jgi:hypothetical protein
MKSTDLPLETSMARSQSSRSANVLHKFVLGGLIAAGLGVGGLGSSFVAFPVMAQGTTEPGADTQGPNTAPDTSPGTPGTAIPGESPGTETETIETDTTVETTAASDVDDEIAQYVLERLQSMTGIAASSLQVVSVDNVSFPNPCIGLAVLGGQCTRAVVQARRVVVTDGNVTWTYYATRTGDVIAIHDFQVETVARAEVQADTGTTPETTVETQTETTVETETQIQRTTETEVQPAPAAPAAPVPALW